MLDNQGILSIFDSSIAIFILLLFLLIISSFLAIPIESFSDYSQNSKTSQDIMESLSTKIEFNDTTFLEDISQILQENHNSQISIKKVSQMIVDELNLNKTYIFKETKVINKVLVSNGDYINSNNFTVATRNCGDYSYTLIIYN